MVWMFMAGASYISWLILSLDTFGDWRHRYRFIPSLSPPPGFYISCGWMTLTHDSSAMSVLAWHRIKKSSLKYIFSTIYSPRNCHKWDYSCGRKMKNGPFFRGVEPHYRRGGGGGGGGGGGERKSLTVQSFPQFHQCYLAHLGWCVQCEEGVVLQSRRSWH